MQRSRRLPASAPDVMRHGPFGHQSSHIATRFQSKGSNLHRTIRIRTRHNLAKKTPGLPRSEETVSDCPAETGSYTLIFVVEVEVVFVVVVTGVPGAACPKARFALTVTSIAGAV